MLGKNGSGKTALLEAIASISNSKYTERFNNREISAKAFYSTVDSFSKELILNVLGEKLIRIENKITCLLPPGDLEVIYCDDKDKRIKEHEDDIDFMMRVLNIDKSSLYSLIDIGTKTLMAGKIQFVHGTYEEEDDYGDYKLYSKYKSNDEPYNELEFKHDNRDGFIPFNCLSSSEQSMLILDLQISKAREVAKQKLTLLLIENLAINFDKNNFENLLRILEQEDFQVIVSIPPYREDQILHKEQGKILLNDFDYLDQWRLSLIG